MGEGNEIHGYKLKDLLVAYDKIRFNDGQTGETVEVIVPTQHKAVGSVTFIFDGEVWVLKEVR